MPALRGCVLVCFLLLSQSIMDWVVYTQWKFIWLMVLEAWKPKIEELHLVRAPSCVFPSDSITWRDSREGKRAESPRGDPACSQN